MILQDNIIVEITVFSLHKSHFNFLPHNPDLKRPIERSLLKTLWEKEKILVTTSDDIKIYYTGKFQDFTARYITQVFVL